MVQLSLNLYYR